MGHRLVENGPAPEAPPSGAMVLPAPRVRVHAAGARQGEAQMARLGRKAWVEAGMRRGGASARGALAAGMLALTAAPAGAQQLSELSCKALWVQRNSIYAERGYCFKTKDAIAVFGKRCYPPYGQLSPDEQRYVDEIRYWEARKGCS